MRETAGTAAASAASRRIRRRENLMGGSSFTPYYATDRGKRVLISARVPAPAACPILAAANSVMNGRSYRRSIQSGDTGCFGGRGRDLRICEKTHILRRLSRRTPG